MVAIGFTQFNRIVSAVVALHNLTGNAYSIRLVCYLYCKATNRSKFVFRRFKKPVTTNLSNIATGIYFGIIRSATYPRITLYLKAVLYKNALGVINNMLRFYIIIV
jgi:hypothetical protein